MAAGRSAAVARIVILIYIVHGGTIRLLRPGLLLAQGAPEVVVAHELQALLCSTLRWTFAERKIRLPSRGWKGWFDGNDVVSRRRRRSHGRLLREKTLETIPVRALHAPSYVHPRPARVCCATAVVTMAVRSARSKERRWFRRKRPCARSRATRDADEDAEGDGVDDGGDDGVDDGGGA